MDIKVLGQWDGVGGCFSPNVFIKEILCGLEDEWERLVLILALCQLYPVSLSFLICTMEIERPLSEQG